MSVTVLSDLILSNRVISAGIRGKNIRQNSRVQTDNGFTSINVGWSQSLRQYEIGTVPMHIDQWQEVEALHEITRGGAYGMLMEDPKDNAVTEGAVSYVPTANGVPAHYQLQRRYVDQASGRYFDRKITRPRAIGFALYQDSALVDPAGYTLDADTGRITMSGMSADTAAGMHWVGRFYVPVQFMDDTIDWEMLAGGSMDQRLLAGPSVVLMEIRE